MKGLKTINITLLIVFMFLYSIETTWGQSQEVTFNFTNGQQSFVVPNGVFSIHIQAYGAQGADADFFDQPGSAGGLGGFAEGDLAVTPGQTLEILVGGQGTVVDDNMIGGGGFNGGGNARGGIVGDERGGGGGASDVRVGGTTLDDRVIVAAGGGGACADAFFGGDGGGLTGEDGGSSPGFGGTQIAGGAGLDPPRCAGGTFGSGGNVTVNVGSCAGGGAGWYGGGAGCNGGGGSSYIDGVENGITTPGVRNGDGLIVLSFISPPNVPTLSEWGLIATAAVLGFIGFIFISRRNANA